MFLMCFGIVINVKKLKDSEEMPEKKTKTEKITSRFEASITMNKPLVVHDENVERIADSFDEFIRFVKTASIGGMVFGAVYLILRIIGVV